MHERSASKHAGVLRQPLLPRSRSVVMGHAVTFAEHVEVLCYAVNACPSAMAATSSSESSAL
eukprot:5996760-Alexandrium_andersonii.AAC.1